MSSKARASKHKSCPRSVATKGEATKHASFARTPHKTFLKGQDQELLGKSKTTRRKPSMVADKKQTTTQPKAAGAEGQASAQADAEKRKPWIKKTPVEIILEQVKKQEDKVAELKKELAKEEGELQKMRKATELLGGS